MQIQMSFENVSGGKEVVRIDLEDNPAKVIKTLENYKKPKEAK